MGKKITIGQARAAGAVGLLFYCGATTPPCSHGSSMTMMLAIALFGTERRLDELRLRCSVCGSRDVDARPDYVARAGTGR